MEPLCSWRVAEQPIPAACVPHSPLPSIWRVRASIMQVRKRFGQHFLHDPGAIRRIVDAVAPKAGERIVEIGPGRGALTWDLLRRAQSLDVIEIDRVRARLLMLDSRPPGGLNMHVETALDPVFLRRGGGGPPLRIV